MLLDILIIIYALWLLLYTVKCEKRSSNGFRYLILGVVFTPLVGYAVMYGEYLIQHFEKQNKRQLRRTQNHYNGSKEVHFINKN